MNRFLLMLCAGCILLAGCRGGRQVAPKFYLIEYPYGQELVVDERFDTLSIPIFVSEVSIHPAFSSHEIAIRENSHEIRYFSNHRWTNRPVQSVKHFAEKFFEEHESFKLVDARVYALQEFLTLDIKINRMEVVLEGKKYFAQLQLEMSIRKADEIDNAFHHAVSRVEPLPDRNLNLFASTISTILMDELKEFSQNLLEELDKKQGE